MAVLTLDLSKGWMPDIPAFEMPEGALFDTDGILPSTIGYRGLGTSSYTATITLNSVARGAFEFIDDPNVVYWGTPTQLYKESALAHTALGSNDQTQYYAGCDITTSDLENQWQFEKYGTWILASNGRDPVQVKKDTTFINLGGAPPTAKYIRVFGERLILGNIGLALSRGTTDTRVASSLFDYQISGANYSKAAVVAGTALSAGTIPQNKYGLYRFTIVAAGTITCTAAAANFTTGYDTEALAIAAIPAVPANNTQMGYITVMSTNAAGFVGGTDALKGGSSGNPAAFTNYYVDCTTRSTKKLLWSALADLENWTPSVTTGCDYQDMPDLQGEITGIQLIPNGFAVISEYSINNGYLAGGSTVFQFAMKERDIGGRPYSSVAANHGIFFISERDIYFYNGETALPIGEPLRMTLFGAVGNAPPSGAYGTLAMSVTPTFSVAHDPEEKIIWWNMCYGSSKPLGGSSILFAFNYKLNQYTKFKKMTIAADDAFCNAVCYSFQHRSIDLIERNHSATNMTFRECKSTTLDGYLTSRMIYARDKDGEVATTMITGVRPRLYTTNETSIVVTVYSRQNESDADRTLTATIAATSNGWADLRSNGKYHRFKTTLGYGALKTMDIKYQSSGKF